MFTCKWAETRTHYMSWPPEQDNMEVKEIIKINTKNNTTN
jgi:hypothetical protein